MEIQTKNRTKRRKVVTRPPGYYDALSNTLAEQGRTEKFRTTATRRNMDSLSRKWSLYCEEERNRDPNEFILVATAADYKTFLKWIVETHPNVRKYSSIDQYWKQAKAIYVDRARKRLDQDLADDVNNYIKVITKEFQLDRSPPKRPVLTVDDLLELLHYNMVLDTAVFPDEEQRLLLNLLLLFAAYTGARPVSLVDASVKNLDESTSDVVRDPAIRFYDSSEEDEDDNTGAKQSGSSEDVPKSEQLKSVLFEHVTIMAVRAQGRMRLAMWVTLIHTKGEDRKPQPKTFRMFENKNPLLCPIAHMVAVGLYHKAFAASSIRDPEDIYRACIPHRKNCIVFRWKEDKLKDPIFREPVRVRGQALSSTLRPLRAQTAARYLKQLGLGVGMEDPLTHTCIRRGTGNSVDNSATVGERDQVMGHSHSGIFQFYINPNVKCDVQAAFLDEPSDKALMKVLGSMSLTRDPLAPTKLQPDDAHAIAQHPAVIKLRQQRDGLTKKIKGFQQRLELGDSVEGEIKLLKNLKKTVEADLRKKKKMLRDHRLKKHRQRYFAENDTRALEEGDDLLLEDEDKNKPTMVYALKERASIVALLCRPSLGLDEPDAPDRRILLVRHMKELCGRREARRRGKAPDPTLPQAKSEDEYVNSLTRLECNARQCLFCIGDEALPVSQRMFCWCRPAKMMDHVEKVHLGPLKPASEVPCPHPGCRSKEVVLHGISHLKRHALEVHGITLRLPKVALS